MATDWLGMCPNIGNCSISDRRERLGEDRAEGHRCPECGRDLLTVQAAEAPGAKKQSAPPWSRIAAGVAVVAVVAGAGLWLALAPPSEKPVSGETAGVEAGPVQLTVAGSNTIGSRLGPVWAAGLLKRMGYSAIAERRVKPDETVIEGRRPEDAARFRILVTAHGTATGFSALADGSANLAMASRPVTDEEAAKLASLGDLRSPSCEHVVALDGVAVIVNRANPLAELTTEQAADLFAGRTTSWSALGGPDTPVSVYARDAKSGTFDTFRSLVLSPYGVELASSARRYEDSAELANAVAADPGAIGFVALPHVGQTKALAIADGGAAVLPSRFTVATEDYPLSRRLYLYSPASLPTAVADYLTFALSNEGQTVAREAGYVGLTIEGVPAPPPPVIAGPPPSEYMAATSGALRLSTNLRFSAGGADFDSRALPDMDRIVDYVASVNAPAEMILLGFTDNSGPSSANKSLSRTRAQAVAMALERRGVRAAQVMGMGAAMPIASNRTPEGRTRNRRVEIWVKAPR